MSDLETAKVELLSDRGSGRALVIVFDDRQLTSELEQLSASLSVSSRVLVFLVTAVSADNWKDLSEALLQQLSEKAVRSASLIGFAGATALLQYIALSDSKLVRSLVLIDASCRPHPSRRDRLIDKIENSLPLGLPFRSATKGFDSKPFLQRIRCPVLLLAGPKNNSFTASQRNLMAENLPTAYTAEYQSLSDLAKLTDDFQAVPVKCPQKNR